MQEFDPEPPISAARKGLATALAWLLFSVANASQVYISMLDHGHSYARILFFNMAVWGLWALMTPVVARLALRCPLLPWRFRTFAVHAGLALAITIGHSAAWTLLTIWIKPYDEMTITQFAGNFWPSLWARLNLELLLYGVVVGVATALETRRSLHARELEAGRLRAQLAGARLHALELQLKPHFLFNTLHTITGLIRGGENGNAVEMIVRLSDLLHQTLASDDAKVIPLDRELELLRAYWEIEEIRFADRLKLRIEVDPAARTALLPPFLLQPLAENAIRHGIAKVAGPVELRLAIGREGEAVDRLAIELFNSGPPLSPGPPGVGLANTRERLRQLYGDDARLELSDVPGGVRARISLPMRPPEAE